MLQRKSTQNVLSTQFVSERDPSENFPASHAAARCVPKSGVSATMNTTATTVPTMSRIDWMASAHTTAAKPPIIE